MPKKAKWGEIPCPECKEPVAWNATRCPHCQAIYSAAQIEARKKANETTGKWGLGCLAVIGIFLIGMCALPDSNNNEAHSSSGDEPVPAMGSAAFSYVCRLRSCTTTFMAGVEELRRGGQASLLLVRTVSQLVRHPCMRVTRLPLVLIPAARAGATSHKSRFPTN